ncbi:O-antigen ligase family protein [Flavobacteriaceae bacterium LMO-SS05]
MMTKRFPFYGLLVISLFPLFNVKGVSILIIFLSILSITYLISDFQSRWSPDIKSFILTSIPYNLYLIGMFYTNDISMGFKALETGLPLIIFPLLYFIVLGKNFVLSKKESDIILNSFTLTGSIFIIITISYLYYNNSFQGLFDREMLQRTTQNRGRDIVRWAIENVPFIGEHPTYLGLISILVSLISIFGIKNISKLYIISLLTGTTGVIISGSKMAILTMIFVGLLGLFIIIKSNTKRIFIFCGLLTFFAVVFASVPMIKVRFDQVLKTNFDPPKDLRYNSTNVRVAIYQCTFANIKKAPIFGNGTRGYINGMRECYKQYKTDIFKRQGWYFNSHNQYLSFVLSNGIIGLILFILWIIVFFTNSILNNDNLFLLSLLVFVLMFFTENLIERQTGNVLYSFLIMLFYKQNVNTFSFKKTNEKNIK